MPWTSSWTIASCCLLETGTKTSYYPSCTRELRRKGRKVCPVCVITQSILPPCPSERWLELQQTPEEEHDPTRCSRRPCGGLWQDVKRLVRRYPSDIKDVLHIQCFLSMFFIFISCVAPAIAFGGLMEEVTRNQIGETETLVGTGLCGIVFSLLGVQPLAIIAFTGPLLLFEEIIIEFAELLQIEYLPWRACIGLWLMLMVIAFAITESTFLVKHFSRFSEEIFSGVIALFFTVEAGRTLVNVSLLTVIHSSSLWFPSDLLA